MADSTSGGAVPSTPYSTDETETARPPSGRVSRRQARTRARLVEAAGTLIAERGVEGLTITDIAAVADVGFGTFYGYFSSKEDITRAVAYEVLTELAVLNDHLPDELPGPAEVLAVAVANILAVTRVSPEKARLAINLVNSNDPDVWAGMLARTEQTLELGSRLGMFSIKDPTIVSHMLIGAVVAAAKALLAGLSTAADDVVITHVLQLVGMPAKRAGQLAKWSVTRKRDARSADGVP